MREYDQIATWYSATRAPEIGLPELRAVAQVLPPGGRVLDLGCGDGIPITRFLVQQGFQVEAVDSSSAMVARFRATLPGVPVRHARAQDLTFPRASFDAVVAWGVLFHLSEADQTALIDRVGAWLRPGGRFLFTSGDEPGTRTGTMDGVVFRYVSLSRDGYRDALAHAGMRLRSAGRDAWDNVVYLAQKPSATS